MDEPVPGIFITYFRNYSAEDDTVVSYGGSELVSAYTLGFTPPAGYVFSEWNTYQDGTGDSYSVGQACPTTTVYAIWQADTPTYSEYIASSSDLTSVANAIRTKAGLSVTLEFPTDFVSAIANIPTGITPTGTKNISISAAGTVTENVTNYASVAVAVPSGTAGTPTATKGSVSNHSITVTPSVTNTTGWVTGSTKNGTGVSVSASELVSGNLDITANGSNIDVTNYATVSVNVSGGSGVVIQDSDGYLVLSDTAGYSTWTGGSY